MCIFVVDVSVLLKSPTGKKHFAALLVSRVKSAESGAESGWKQL